MLRITFSNFWSRGWAVLVGEEKISESETCKFWLNILRWANFRFQRNFMFQTLRNGMVQVRTRYLIQKCSNSNIREQKTSNVVPCRVVCSPIASKPVSFDAELNSASYGRRCSAVWVASYRPKTEYSKTFRKALAP